MKVQINNSEMIVDENVSIRSILEITNSPTEGVAFAVNDSVVPRSQWDSFVIKENDNILIIKAARGGWNVFATKSQRQKVTQNNLVNLCASLPLWQETQN